MKRFELLSALILIVSALLLGGASSSPNLNPAPSNLRSIPENSQPRKAYDQPAKHYESKGLSSSNVTTSPTPFPNDNADGNTGQSKHEAAQYRLNRLQTWFNAFLAFFTAALVAVGGWQARRLRQTVEATQDAADAAKKSADVSERAFKLSERPWITVQGWNLKRPDDLTRNFGVDFDIRNFGKSPAWITKLRAKLVLIKAGTDFPTPPDYTSKFEVWHADARGRVIPPGESIARSCPFEETRPLADSEYKAWTTSALYFWVYGIVEYADFSGDPHVTAFSAQHGFVIRQDAIGFAEQEDHWYPDAGGEEYHYHDRKKSK